MTSRWDISVAQAKKMAAALTADLKIKGHLHKDAKVEDVGVALEHAINQHVNEVNDGQHGEDGEHKS